MSVTESPASTRLALLERSASRAAELALDVSLAARVEPELLRAARLAAGFDASVEAELWFSGIVSAAGRLGLVLDRSVADLLRLRLAQDGDRLEAAWRLIERHHAGLPWSIRLEERINYLTARGGDAGEVEELLAAAVTEMWDAPEADESAGIARWLLAAVARLPAAARASGAASAAAVAAGTHLDGRVSGLDGLDEEQRRRWLPWLMERVDTTEVRVRLVPDRLVISAAGGEGVPLELPATDPLVVTVSSRGPDGAGAAGEARLRDGESWSGEAAGPEVEVRTLSGSGLVLRPAGVGRIVVLNAEGGFGRALGIGFAVSPGVVLTAAPVLASEDVPPEALAYVHGDRPPVRVSFVRTDPDLEVAMLHLAAPAGPTLPVLPPSRGARWRVPGARLSGVVIGEGVVSEVPGISIMADPDADAHPGLAGSPLLLEDPWGAAIAILVRAVRGPLGPPPESVPLSPVLHAVPLAPILERHGLDSETAPERPAERRRRRPLADLVTLPMIGRDLPVLRDLDPELLGFRNEYRLRHEDATLRAGIRDADGVVVWGPPGVGKSRSLFEAARAELPDARFVAPRRAVDVLPDLAIHPAIEADPGDLVIWLDPLDEFVFPGSGLKPAFDSFRLRHPRTVLLASLSTEARASLTDSTPDGAAALEIIRESFSREIAEGFPEADEDPVERLEQEVRHWRSEGNQPFLADALMRLAAELAAREEGRRAVEAAGEALNIHRELESTNALYRDHVANDFLAMAGYIEAPDDAVRYAGEAVERYRALAQDHLPGRYDAQLSRALLEYARRLERLGAKDEARAAKVEAEKLLRPEQATEDDVA